MNAEQEREIRRLLKAKAKAQRGGAVGEEAAACNSLGELLAGHGRYEEALEEHRRELLLREGAGDRLGCAIAHRKIGERLAELERYGAALQHQQQHLELAVALGDHTEQQRAWATIGRTHMFIGDSRAPGEEREALDEAQRAFHTSLAIVEQRLEGSVPAREVAEMKARLFLNLALVSDSLKEPEQRERYLGKSIFLAEQGGLQEDLYRAHFNRGSILLRDGDHSGALRSLSRARECARSLGDRAMESESCASTAQVLLALGDFAAARRSLRQALALGPRQPQHRRLVRANLRYATRALRLLRALEGAGGDAAAALPLCEELGDLCCEHGDYGRALGFYQRQLGLAQALARPPRDLAAIHGSLATTFGDLRDPARALHHFRQELGLHRGDPLEEGKTLLNMALTMAEAGEPPPTLLPCLQRALERATEAGAPRLQLQVLRQLHAEQLRGGDAAGAAGTRSRLEALGGAPEEEEEEEEEEERGSSESLEESDLELSTSEEDEELQGCSGSAPGRRRPSRWNRRNERGETPLHRACIEGDLRRVQLLLQQGHPVNPRDYCGWTPLHEACNHGHLEIVRVLLAGGAARDDPGGPGCEGVTPLHDALSCGHFEVAQTLLQHGASATVRDSAGMTPLGTLQQWLSTYREELDRDTWEQAQAMERILREAAGPGSGGDRDQDQDQDQDHGGSTSPLMPMKKRHRALDPDGCAAPSPGPGSTSSRALIPEEQYLREQRWLEDDLGMARGSRKRPRRECQEPGDGDARRMGSNGGGRRRRRGAPRDRIPMERGGSRDRIPMERGGSRDRIPMERGGSRDRIPMERGGSRDRIPMERGGSRDRIPMERGGSRDRIPMERGGSRDRIPMERGGSRDSGSPVPEEDMDKDKDEDMDKDEDKDKDEDAEGGENPAPPPAPLPTLRVRVRIQDNVFLIPVPQSQDLPVLWLAERAAERFQHTCGSRPRLLLYREGARLEPRDLVRDVLRSNEEVVAEAQGWELPPLAERYRRVCRSMDVEPHEPLLKVLQRQEQSPGLVLGGALAPPPRALPALLRALRLQPGLRVLALRGCGLGAAAAPELLAAAAALPALALLDLGSNRMGPAALRLLCPRGAGAAFQALEELDLSLNPLGDGSCAALAELLRCCPALSTLRLRACRFGPAFSLDGAARLRVLSMSHNALGPLALERLLGTASRHRLTRLELGSITGPGTRNMGAIVGGYLRQEGSSALSHLVLSGNHLSDGDVVELARCLPLCPALDSLDLGANPGISTAGMRLLLRALEQRKRGLSLLSLAGCSVEAPLDDPNWSRATLQIQDLRLCGRSIAHPYPSTASRPLPARTLARHRKLLWKSP